MWRKKRTRDKLPHAAALLTHARRVNQSVNLMACGIDNLPVIRLTDDAIVGWSAEILCVRQNGVHLPCIRCWLFRWEPALQYQLHLHPVPRVALHQSSGWSCSTQCQIAPKESPSTQKKLLSPRNPATAPLTCPPLKCLQHPRLRHKMMIIANSPIVLPLRTPSLPPALQGTGAAIKVSFGQKKSITAANAPKGTLSQHAPRCPSAMCAAPAPACVCPAQKAADTAFVRSVWPRHP